MPKKTPTEKELFLLNALKAIASEPEDMINWCVANNDSMEVRNESLASLKTRMANRARYLYYFLEKKEIQK